MVWTSVSPMWSRGKNSASKIATESSVSRASRAASVAPAGPPPMMATSYTLS